MGFILHRPLSALRATLPEGESRGGDFIFEKIFCLNLLKQFQTENKLRPSFASLMLGTFPPMGRHEEADCFMQAREKEKN